MRVNIRIERGRPFSRLAMFEPYHLAPAVWKLPPRYAGIAIMRRSAVGLGMLGNGECSGKVIIAPWESLFGPAMR
ncbi:hypothetical protein D3C85_1599750 [compost metagenome]